MNIIVDSIDVRRVENGWTLTVWGDEPHGGEKDVRKTYIFRHTRQMMEFLASQLEDSA